MTDPNQHLDDELDLDAETVKDLEPTEEDADAAKGGALITAMSNCGACASGRGLTCACGVHG
ncbi:MAG: hypothetical protein E6G50_00280 [Actinobacteria bacterium]|nr:MAG: hypothetical protein E6G50_00280 [Actinomycetota bacterium]